VFILKCSMSVKLLLKIPLPLLNLNIIIKRSKHPREIKGLLSVVNKVLHKSQTVLPNNINSDKYMAHCFNNFFCTKILNIHSGFHSSNSLQGKPLVEESCISIMDTFEPFTETDIRQLLKKSSNAFCVVDPMACERLSGCSDKPNFKYS